MNKNNIDFLKNVVKQMKKDVFLMAYNSGTKGAHIGGTMSIMEILATLYGVIMNYDVSNPCDDNRDRLILSKAHCAIGLYSALKFAGFLTENDISSAMQGDSPYFKHPKMNIEKGIEFSSGSLGQGISLSVGSAIALRLKGVEPNFYVILGDGELDEGSVWEGLNSIIQYKLNNITVIIDKNNIQNDGFTYDIMNKGNLNKRLDAIGFDVIEVDGHDIEQLLSAFNTKTDNAKVIIANTIKGNSISFSHNKVDWHINYVNEELYKIAIEEIDRQ